MHRCSQSSRVHVRQFLLCWSSHKILSSIDVGKPSVNNVRKILEDTAELHSVTILKQILHYFFKMSLS